MREHESALIKAMFFSTRLGNTAFGPACEGDEFPELDEIFSACVWGLGRDGILDVRVGVIRIYYSAECLATPAEGSSCKDRRDAGLWDADGMDL